MVRGMPNDLRLKKRSRGTLKRLAGFSKMKAVNLLRMKAKSQNENTELTQSDNLNENTTQYPSITLTSFNYFEPSGSGLTTLQRFASSPSVLESNGNFINLPSINTVQPIDGLDLTSVIKPISKSYHSSPQRFSRRSVSHARNTENLSVLRMIGTDHLRDYSGEQIVGGLNIAKSRFLEPINSMHSAKFKVSTIKDDQGNEIGEIVDHFHKVNNKINISCNYSRTII